MSQKDKERFQFISFASIKRNFFKVFGSNHDAMAEILFRYISNCRVDSRQKDFLHDLKNRDVLNKYNKTTTIEDFDTQNDIHKVRVNFWTFIQKFDAMWLKKPQVIQSKEPSVIEQMKFQARQRRIREQNHLVFKILDLDGDD